MVKLQDPNLYDIVAARGRQILCPAGSSIEGLENTLHLAHEEYSSIAFVSGRYKLSIHNTLPETATFFRQTQK